MNTLKKFTKKTYLLKFQMKDAMKKAIPFFLIFLFSINMYSQEESKPTSQILGNNELKLNALLLIAELPEITYERIISNESSIGFSFAFSLDNSSTDYNFYLLPYYRLYFGEKRAAGFFLEANAMFFSEDRGIIYTDNGTSFQQEDEFGAGLGIAVGGKFLTKKGWIGELSLGIGRVFVNKYFDESFYPRIGITIGKRF